MKIPRKLLFPFMLLLTVLSLPNRVLACACCAEPGEYRIGYAKPTSEEFGFLKRMRFGNTANLYTNAAGIEGTSKGITNPSETYTLTGSLIGNRFSLTFRDGNKSGVLTLPLPAKMLSYAADIHEGSGSIEPRLYKEWRFEGIARGTGVFSAGIAGSTTYFLVLQGRGNNCDNAEDFTHWRLAISGRKASYAFYGELAKPVEEKKAE
jgi:hypothetical protein